MEINSAQLLVGESESERARCCMRPTIGRCVPRSHAAGCCLKASHIPGLRVLSLSGCWRTRNKWELKSQIDIYNHELELILSR